MSDTIKTEAIKLPPRLVTELSELDHAIFTQVSEICEGPEYPEYWRLPEDVRKQLDNLSLANVAARETLLAKFAQAKTETTRLVQKRAVSFIVATVSAYRSLGRLNPGSTTSKIEPRSSEPTTDAIEFMTWIMYEVTRIDLGHEQKWPEFELLSTANRESLFIKMRQSIIEHDAYIARLLG